MQTHVLTPKQLPNARNWHIENTYFKGTSIQHQRPCTSLPNRQSIVKTVNFKFMKELGLKKPSFLPDFGLEKRKAVLSTVFTNFDSTSLSPALSDELTLSNAGKNIQTKQEFITLLEELKAAAPDWTWQHETTAANDDAGFATVKLQGGGKFDGKTFAPPTIPPVEPHGKQVEFAGQTARIRVEDGTVKQIEFTSSSGDFLDQLYKALGGKIPLSK